MAVAMNTFSSDVAALRAFLARNRVRHQDLAGAVGVSRSYISHVLRADQSGKAVSRQKLNELWEAALRLARKRA